MTDSIDWGRRGRVADGVLETAGLTPAVRLNRVAPEGVEIVVSSSTSVRRGASRTASCPRSSGARSGAASCARG